MGRILLAEDNSMMRALAKRHIPKEFEVIEVEDGLPALYSIADGVDAAIIDDIMPYFNGRCLLALLKNINKFSFWYRSVNGGEVKTNIRWSDGQRYSNREIIDSPCNTAIRLALESLEKKYSVDSEPGKVKLSDLCSDKLYVKDNPKYKPPELDRERIKSAVGKILGDIKYSKIPVILTVKQERESTSYRDKIQSLGPPDGYIVKPNYYELGKHLGKILGAKP